MVRQMTATKVLKNLEKPELLPGRIADLIRDAILKGELAPGARLIEQQLAQQWNISRAPLREAIRQLATEGLITLSPHRGASVSEVSTAARRGRASGRERGCPYV